jgi:hypothetical protein
MFDKLYFLFPYFFRRGDGGILCLKDVYRPYFHQNSRPPWSYRVPHPSEICEYIQEQYPEKHRGGDLFSGNLFLTFSPLFNFSLFILFHFLLFFTFSIFKFIDNLMIVVAGCFRAVEKSMNYAHHFTMPQNIF